MTPRPRSPGTGGHSDADAPTTRDRSGDGSGSPRRPRGPAPVQSVSQAQHSVSQAAHLGRPGSSSTGGTQSGSGGSQQGQLPPGYTRDADGNVHGPDGRYANDPFAPPRPHTRDAEYPPGYRQSTHDEMVRRYTLEGQAIDGVPRDANGNRIPRDQLTWVDDQGREIEFDADNPITYDHVPPVVEHWNTEGHNAPRGDRNDWYNDPDHLVPMTRRDNSSAGGQMTDRYRQDVGDDYLQ